MKKHLLTLAVALVAGSVLAQGTINFSTASAKVKINNVNAASTTGAKVQLVWGAAGTVATQWDPSLSLTAWLAQNPELRLISNVVNVGTPVAGTFNGGTLTATPLAPAGSVIQAWVVGWAGTPAYTSFDAAFNAGFSGNATTYAGVSPSFQIDTGDPTASPAGTPGTIGAFTSLNMVTIVPVPEPTSFAMAGLGAAALLIFRRRS